MASAAGDPLDKVRGLLSELNDAIDALGSDESAEGEPEAAAAEAPTPDVSVALPWRGRGKRTPAKRSKK